MRNLKKVLSLVLALAMVLSICMVGAGAVNYDDFTDEESITKKQAVETLVSLDVINGYNDGAEFRPTGNVTRAEMATMICRVLAGGDNMIVDATKPVPTYTDIRDNPSAAWAESYIEYCTSLGIVSGKGNGIFDPMADVTAAEAAKMVMTTLGYNADIEGFKGIGWDINTMAKANTLQLLTNLQGEISANQPVTREQVAQLLFNALTAFMVQNYNGNMANTWVGSGADAYHQTLLESKFNVEKVTGVVEANEFADLYAESPIRTGTTRLNLMDANSDITGKTRVVNVSTTLDQIGHSVIVYCDKTTDRVVYGNTQDTGLNQVKEFTTEMELTAGREAPYTKAELKDTEYFVNFGDDKNTTAEVDRYFAIMLTKVTVDELAGTVTVTDSSVDANNQIVYYRVGDKLSAQEYRTLKKHIETLIDMEDANQDENTYTYSVNQTVEIRNKGTYVPFAFSGRASSTEWDDATNVQYSNFDGFSRYYLTNIEDYNGEAFAGNLNGNYLKCVDANNDGIVDYALKTIYTASTVQRIAKNGDITLSNYNDEVDGPDACNVIVTSGPNKTDVVLNDDLAVGDVVLYTVIDGTAYVSLADMISAQIDSVHKNNITVTTEDGDTYNQSGVNMVFTCEALDDLCGVTEDSEDNSQYITQMKGKTSYDIYFDLYGNIVAYRTSMRTGNFVLLTDGWFNRQKDGDEYAVKAYIDDKIGVYDVDKGAKSFVDRQADTDVTTDDNSWGKLKEVKGIEGYYEDYDFLTTVAAYSMNNDNVLTLDPVDQVFNKRNVDVVVMKDNTAIDGTNMYLEGKAFYTGTATTDADEHDNTYLDPVTFTYTGEQGKWNATRGNRTVATNLGEDWVGGTEGNVKVRPRSDTVYYYVSTNSKGETSVDCYTGYAKAPKVAADQINGVYAVGTEYGDYYIANAVVVELKSTYRTGAELVFIYDGPQITNKVGDGHFDIINSKGEIQDVVISYTNGNKAEGTYEGLYWMYKQGDKYVVDFDNDKVAEADYEKNNIAIGYVGGWIDGTKDYDYIWIDRQYDNQSAAEADNKALPEKRLMVYKDDSSRVGSYYELDYTTNRVDEEVARPMGVDLTAADVLAEKVGEHNDKDNMVLVLYNKNNEVVWAVSFKLNERANDNHTAERIWNRLLPTYTPAVDTSHTVTVKYTENGVANDALTETVKVADGENYTLTLPADDVATDHYTYAYTSDTGSSTGYAVKAPNSPTATDKTITFYGVKDDFEVVIAKTGKPVAVKINKPASGVNSWTLTGAGVTDGAGGTGNGWSDTDGDTATVVYGTTVTLAVTPTTGTTNYKWMNSEGWTDKTITEPVDFTIAVATVSNAKALTTVKLEGHLDVTGNTTMTVNDLAHGTTSINMELVHTGASCEVYAGVVNPSQEIDPVDGVYTLPVAAAGRTYVIRVIAADDSHTDYTLTLSTAAANTGTAIAISDAGTGIVTTVTNTASGEEVEVAAAMDGILTVGQLINCLKPEAAADEGATIAVLEGAGGAAASADAIVTTTMKVQVTPQSGGAAVEYDISFA